MEGGRKRRVRQKLFPLLQPACTFPPPILGGAETRGDRREMRRLTQKLRWRRMSREVTGSPHHASLNSQKKLVLFICTFFRISKMPPMETTFQKEGEYGKGGWMTLRSCFVHRQVTQHSGTGLPAPRGSKARLSLRSPLVPMFCESLQDGGGSGTGQPF